MQEVVVKNDVKVEDMIYEIRGKYVMLDSDLALLYGCKNGTKEVNQAVKNNPKKFPERFSWILEKDEYDNLRSKILTSSYEKLHGGSVSIMRAFVKMRHYLSSNLLEQKYINNMVLEHDYDIKIIQESLDKLEKDKEINEVYFNGKIYDAYSKVLDIFSEAKDELIIVDRYTDKTILDMIKNLECNVILITSKRGKLTELDIDKYNSDYHNLSIYYDDTFHDRYFIIDRDCLYHSGNSINHIGFRKSSIDIIHDENVKELIISDINIIIGGICSE